MLICLQVDKTTFYVAKVWKSRASICIYLKGLSKMYDFSILISIKPRFTREIFVTKIKDLELRKSRPARFKGKPFRVYVYESGSGCVIGHFICDNIRPVNNLLGNKLIDEISSLACVTPEEFRAYNPTCAYGICERTLYAKPIPYIKFAQQHRVGERPPQSWCYVAA